VLSVNLSEGEGREERTHVGRTDLDASDVGLNDVLAVADVLCCPEVTESISDRSSK
jgi:hypothetical protein